MCYYKLRVCLIRHHTDAQKAGAKVMLLFDVKKYTNKKVQENRVPALYILF